MTERFSRRRFLHATVASSGLALLAGCTAGGSQSGDESGGSGDGSESTTTADVESRDFDGWFDRTSNYEGVYDMTDKDAVTVAVGVSGNSGAYAFDPAAVRVAPGTTVTWEWTGSGGAHNVVERENDSFQSELTATEGHTFEYTFEDSGEYRYVCVPHETFGMVGAVVVE
ncbi:halocyanin precursor-like protein [Haloferax mucosum ATCC BAA-1512]|uniref:Halocyanin-like protein n=1 Tax=Haloferax mucosum ATCC BAA-1512 TaxID=662479 RepID=M0I661_9EURY|nr:halocyanin domain-containing protein [Haloferax mucosum]ELZ91452.1 halocyanin precursor-like protein [Haloferax mucosum ATCC BAA-1512]